MSEIDRDPGMTLRVFVADVEPIAGGDLTVGTPCRIIGAVFKGIEGHVHEFEPEGNAIVREGDRAGWIAAGRS